MHHPPQHKTKTEVQKKKKECQMKPATIQAHTTTTTTTPSIGTPHHHAGIWRRSKYILHKRNPPSPEDADATPAG